MVVLILGLIRSVIIKSILLIFYITKYKINNNSSLVVAIRPIRSLCIVFMYKHHVKLITNAIFRLFLISVNESADKTPNR